MVVDNGKTLPAVQAWEGKAATIWVGKQICALCGPFHTQPQSSNLLVPG